MANIKDFIAHYKADTVSGGILVDETSTHQGALTGGFTGSALSPFSVGGSVELDNVDGYAKVSGIVANQDMSFSLWFNCRSIGAAFPDNLKVILSTNLISGKGFSLALQNGATNPVLNFVQRDSAITSTAIFTPTTEADVVLNTWNHLGFIYSAGEVKLYLNGILCHHYSINIAYSNLADLYIGREGSNTDYRLDGYADNIKVFNRVLSPFEIGLLSREHIILPIDYIAKYTMDSISGVTLQDETSTYDITLSGTSVTNGVLGDALLFNGTSDYATMPTIASMISWSVSCYAKINTSALGQYLFDQATPRRILALDVAGSSNTLGYYDGTVWHAVADVLPTTSYAHILFSYDGSNIAIYLNGVKLLSEAASGFTWNGTGLLLGKNSGASGDFLNGAIDQLYLFNRALVDGEVLSLYEELRVWDDLAAFYTMDNISGNTLIDETGSHNATVGDQIPFEGYLGNALQFTGDTNANATIDVPINPSTILGDNFTISCWVRPTTNGNYHGIFGNHFGTPAQGVVGFQDGSGAWAVGWGNNGVFNAANLSYADIPLDTWTHLILRCTNGTDLAVFSNGDIKVNQTGVTISHNATFKIGTAYGDGSTAGRNFIGRIDQFRIYSKSLDQASIDALYFEQIFTKVLSGTITETLGVADWNVRSYRVDDGALTASVSTNNGTFELIVDITNDVPHLITCSPEQGTPWIKEEVLAINQLRYPTDPSTTPYYYKVTIAGTTGVTEPVWATVPGQTVVDGTVTLACVERFVQPITHSPVIPQ